MNLTNETDEIYSQDLEDFASHRLLYILREYARWIIPLVCGFGFLADAMAMVLLRSHQVLKRLASNIYLYTLSVSGLVYLATVVLAWIDTMWPDLPLYNTSEFGCRVLTTAAHLSDFICVYMIAYVSCDRLIVLCRPHLVQKIYSHKVSQRITLGTALFGCVFYSLLLVMAEIEVHDGKPFCGAGYQFHENGYYFYFTIADSILCSIIPAVTVLTVNSMAIFRYRKCQKLYALGAIRVRFDEHDVSHPPIAESSQKVLLSRQSRSDSSKPVKSNGDGRVKYSDLRLSFSLTVATSIFLCMTVPSYILRLYIYYCNPESPLIFFARFITMVLYYMHHSALALIYIFGSPHMRTQIKPAALKLLECYCFKSVHEPEWPQTYQRLYIVTK